ncbi:hypothetical protein C7444_10178 [Sphaerotilus hippei]|uniref:Uncharacterized protein n=1 Tax=Sphaerotilus hippei TaxID=744406 RepID=A0A318HDF6_9BURK|nr:hypothetical protein [Sphaerotilus hippei]PXW99249.1 hypothetical protein C7444_10178 [Sphaerotilus hippei]
MGDDTMIDSNRQRLAGRIHDLLLYELGEDVDMNLMLGPPEYARAVLSLCRASGNAELVRLGDEFSRLPMPPAGRPLSVGGGRRGQGQQVGVVMSAAGVPSSMTPLS